MQRFDENFEFLERLRSRKKVPIEEEVEKDVKWIDKRTKKFSIEVFDRIFDVYVYSTPYGMLEFVEKIVENYTYGEPKVEITFYHTEFPGYYEKLISFDRHTGELCLKMSIGTKHGYYGYYVSKLVGRLKFNLSIDKSRQREIMDFVCTGYPFVHQAYPSYKCCDKCKATPKKDHLIRQLNDSLKLEDSVLFFNRKLTNLAIPFMKKIRQSLINICIFLDIPFSSTVDKLIHQVWFQILNSLLARVLTNEKSLVLKPF